MKMQTIRDDFFQLTNDLARNGLGKNPSSYTHRHFPADDYTPHGTQPIDHPVITSPTTSHPDVIDFSSRDALTPDQPPEIMG